jgi:hypothetical protein
MPLIVPGLDPVGVAAGVSRLRQLCEEAGRDPATMPVWWRVYLVDGWQGRAEEARTLGCTHFSVGAPRGVRLDDQLATIVGAKAEVESLLAGE